MAMPLERLNWLGLEGFVSATQEIQAEFKEAREEVGAIVRRAFSQLPQEEFGGDPRFVVAGPTKIVAGGIPYQVMQGSDAASLKRFWQAAFKLFYIEEKCSERTGNWGLPVGARTSGLSDILQPCDFSRDFVKGLYEEAREKVEVLALTKLGKVGAAAFAFYVPRNESKVILGIYEEKEDGPFPVFRSVSLEGEEELALLEEYRVNLAAHKEVCRSSQVLDIEIFKDKNMQPFKTIQERLKKEYEECSYQLLPGNALRVRGQRKGSLYITSETIAIHHPEVIRAMNAARAYIFAASLTAKMVGSLLLSKNEYKGRISESIKDSLSEEQRTLAKLSLPSRECQEVTSGLISQELVEKEWQGSREKVLRIVQDYGISQEQLQGFVGEKWAKAKIRYLQGDEPMTVQVSEEEASIISLYAVQTILKGAL